MEVKVDYRKPLRVGQVQIEFNVKEGEEILDICAFLILKNK